VVGTIPAKIFEYFAAQRPILAFGGPEGEVSKILKKTNAGIFAKSEEEIKNYLLNSYNEWKKDGYTHYYGEMSEINKYSQREMANKFVEVLDNICNN
jgi:hypothetical protein